MLVDLFLARFFSLIFTFVSCGGLIIVHTRHIIGHFGLLHVKYTVWYRISNLLRDENMLAYLRIWTAKK